LVDIRGFECAKYCSIVDILLLLNGFTYVLLFSINASIPIVGSRMQAIGMVSASYGGAGLLSPFLGYAILHYVGFKATFTTSLAIFCVGTLIFWPSGALGSYPGFIIASVVVGVALASIEIAASTFNALCGPSEYAVIRVLLGTGLEAVGATLGFFLGYTAISINVDDTRGLIALQWAYFVIALFTVLLGLFFYYIPLPEATESDLQSQPDLLWVDPSQKYFGIFPVIFTPLLLAVLSCFCAAGALASLRSFIGSVLTVVSTSTHSVPMLSITDFQTAITAIYASGNFFFAFLCFLIPPRLVLLGAYASGITFGVLIIALQHHSVDSVQAITLAFSAFQGAIPNLCYAIVLHGLGRWTKLACCAMIGGASLGASIWPWVMLTVASGHSAQYAFCIVIALFTAGCSFPLYLNLDPVARGWGRPPGWRTVANVIQQYRS
jgi:fucose permease